MTGHCLVGTLDADRDDRDVKFARQDGEHLLEVIDQSVAGARSFGEDDDVLALFQGFTQFQDRVLHVRLLHDDDVVA